ncbi:phytanoyl-CoA dioxygenase [Capsaspora owczarzaki ATCC 30864]|uniref:Phytanoyl-CoA dioxygenase n=1 Tax=Capsaspora owczarzaki (strain ATCC 30864) TaxID=595528 RepID=A0A0D2VZY9_CAPO3|nr:phytanoyl-CoA dioxygenase [Capsaspora owczarzaki ATCC 30864]KJE97457.1 phytanoyl-CoA dioxygenase [Capsaspora owczarzaki ATCC 30864]|eukprot:XP_004343172.2 phytanoyl-CoA dioxygenase [Capsaspora owczarzaki ATCC 30864]
MAALAISRRMFTSLSAHSRALASLSATPSSAAAAARKAEEPQPAAYANRILPMNQVEQYNRDGFLVVPNLFTPAEKQQVFSWTDQIGALPETKGKWMQYFENKNGQRLLCRTENFLDYFPELDKLIRGKITDAVSDLLQEPALLFKEKVNFKLPHSSGFEPHQDAPAYTTFKQRLHLTAMIAVDKAVIDNGCLEVVRGEHTKGMLPHPGGVMEEWLVKKWEQEKKWEPVQVEAGTILFFGSFLPHRSGANNSDRSRRAHYITYNALSDGDFRAAYYADKRIKFPPQIERVPGVDYSAGASVYNVANPIDTKA